jgi:citrate lyase subunit beta/citryl-CoA lyase
MADEALIRSLLFVPGDSERKQLKSLESAADCLILDLEDSVMPQNKAAARGVLATFLASETARNTRIQLYVRVNALDTGLTAEDLAAVMQAHPDGIVLPKSRSADEVRELHRQLERLEAAHRRTKSPARILPIVTETAGSLFNLGGYKDCSPRLWGMMWGAEDLSADLGATRNRLEDGSLTPPFELARSLCLYACAHAGVVAVDAISPVIGDPQAIAREAAAARRDGFGAKAAIHPGQLAPINEQMSPSAEELAWAKAVIAAFADPKAAGATTLNGKMLDRPHLRLAQRMLGIKG